MPLDRDQLSASFPDNSVGEVQPSNLRDLVAAVALSADLSSYVLTANLGSAAAHAASDFDAAGAAAAVESQLANYLPLAGGTITGSIDITGQTILDNGAISTDGHGNVTIGGTTNTAGEITINLASVALVPALTGPSRNGVTVTDNVNGSGWQIFDPATDAQGSEWNVGSQPSSGSPFIFTIQFPSPVEATSYTATKWFYNSGNPNVWLVQGSNDGSNWTTLASVNGAQGARTYGDTAYNYPITSPGVYTYYRWNITGIDAFYGGTGIAAFQLFSGGPIEVYQTLSTLTDAQTVTAKTNQINTWSQPQTFSQPIIFSAAASAPANTTTPAAWAAVQIGANSYKLPLYQ